MIPSKESLIYTMDYGDMTAIFLEDRDGPILLAKVLKHDSNHNRIVYIVQKLWLDHKNIDIIKSLWL